MDKNFDFIASELFNKIKTQFPRLTLGDKDRKNISNDQVQNARFFEFDYEHKGEKLGHITATLSEKDGLVVIFSNDLIGDKSEYVKKAFFNFLREMRKFAKGHLLNFDTRDISKSNLEKRDYKFLSKNQFGDSAMSESKLFGTSRTSYQDLGDARLIVKHSAPVNFEHPAGRAQRIESIYVENNQGERFKYPYRHLNGARALAQHVSHGGTPYDNIGKHVIGLSEELNKLRMFKNYVERNEAINEAMGTINSRVNERIAEVKKEIHSLQSAGYYKQFRESFTEHQVVEIPEDVVNDWIDRLTIRSFNEELKNVFPYIFKLVGESDIPVKEITADDLVEPTEESVADDFESTIAELDEYEGFLNKIAEGKSELFGDNNQDLIDQLNQLLGEEIPLGQDGTNAINSLKGIIDDDKLEQVFREMADIDPAIDARDVIRDYVESKDQEYGTDVASQLNFEGGAAAPAEEPVEVPAEEPAAEMPSPEVPAEEPAAAAPPVQESTTREGLHSMFDELKEFIGSMYNANEGNFPKGVEGVKIACEKKFGDRVGPIAAKIVERMTTMGEMKRIAKLSGVEEGIFDKLRAMNYDRLAKRSDKKSSAALDRAMDYDFSDPDRQEPEGEFMKYADQRDSRLKKSAELRYGAPQVVDDKFIATLVKKLPSDLVDYDEVVYSAKEIAAKILGPKEANKNFWYDEEVDDMSDNARKLISMYFKDEGVAEGYTGRETKDGTWRVFKDGEAVAAAGPFKSREEAAAWIKKQKKGVAEGFNARQRTRLNDLIDQFRDATDPNDYYDREYSDPEEVIDIIRQEFGDRIANQVNAGANKMHFSRPGHTSWKADPLGWKKPIDRQTKAGKMYKQDSDFRKNTIKSRYKLGGKSATEGVAEGDLEPPERRYQPERDPDWEYEKHRQDKIDYPERYKNMAKYEPSDEEKEAEREYQREKAAELAKVMAMQDRMYSQIYGKKNENSELTHILRIAGLK